MERDMTTRHVFVGGSAALAALALAGCGDSTGPALDATTLQNAAVMVADATIEDVTLATTPFGFGAAAAPATSGEREGFGEPGGRGGIGGTFSGTRSVTFYDASGTEQGAYDPLTTASIHVLLDLAGDVTRDTWSASVQRSRDLTISGLEGEETTRTFNGTGSETVSRSRVLDDGTQASHEMSGTFTYEDVVVPVPGSEPRWPLSGKIHRTLNVDVVNGPNGDQSRTLDVTVTFDGDSTATAVINGETVEIDLSTRWGGFPIHRGRFGRSGG
jgi:hypothetical protein